jgi:transcriptional regulator with XRE-family HTH domain
MTFGEFLRYARQSAGVSQRELGKILGVSSGYLSDVEHDRRNPLNHVRLMKAASRLGISLLAATKAKASGDGFFRLASAPHHDYGERVAALLSLAWLDLSPADFIAMDAIARRALKRAGVEPDMPPEEA